MKRRVRSARLTGKTSSDIRSLVDLWSAQRRSNNSSWKMVCSSLHQIWQPGPAVRKRVSMELILSSHSTAPHHFPTVSCLTPSDPGVIFRQLTLLANCKGAEPGKHGQDDRNYHTCYRFWLSFFCFFLWQLWRIWAGARPLHWWLQ